MKNTLDKLSKLKNQVNELMKWHRQGSLTMVNREAHYQALTAVKDHVVKYVTNLVSDMKNEDIKHVGIAGCEITIRKIMSDMYSGQVRKGTELIHQFDRITIPQLAGQLQSLLELYDPDKVEESNSPNEILINKLKPLAEHAENGMVSQLITMLSSQSNKVPTVAEKDPRTEAAEIIAEANAITEEAKSRMQRVDPRAEIADLKERVESMLHRVESLVSANSPTSKEEDKTVDTLHQMQQKHDLLTDRVQQELNILQDKMNSLTEKLSNYKPSGGKTITITVD